MKGQVRIIGGQWRGRRLAVPPAAPLRPTPDRVRETVFNWLQDRIRGARCLDMFAGSGALGFEAASRGAAAVTMLEHSRRLVAALEASAAQLQAHQVRIENADALHWEPAGGENYDIVFLDPPYGVHSLGRICETLTAQGILADDAVVYLETSQGHDHIGLPADWRIERRQRAGKVRYYLAAPGQAG